METRGIQTFAFVSSQHVVYFTKFVLSYVIPDVPYVVKEQIKREKYLTHIILHETKLNLVTKGSSSQHNDDQMTEDTESKDDIGLDF